MLSHGARPIRTSLCKDRMAFPYAALRPRHSARAAAPFFLELALEHTLRSELKWLKTEAWTDANFCKLRMRLKRCIARLRRGNCRCEFSARLFFQRPVSCRFSTPMSFSASRYDRNLSVTKKCG